MKTLYLLDTCVFISRFSAPGYSRLIDSLIAKGKLLLSSVVIMELYAGTASREAKMELDRFVRRLDISGLLTTPDSRDYRDAGVMLRAYSNRHGKVASSPHFRDILIALSAVKSGAAVVTENLRDFTRWQGELKRGLGKELAVLSADELWQ